jgi:hypothetical protein
MVRTYTIWELLDHPRYDDHEPDYISDYIRDDYVQVDEETYVDIEDLQQWFKENPNHPYTKEWN